jgi:alanyl-tRNA synthetase
LSSERLYFTDAYSTQFTAVIIERLEDGGSPAVILDRSLFYPDSGGQPHDTGKINEISVVNVYIRESDQAVVHVLADDPLSDSVSGEVDWHRRFDHMQQHTGQHILSKALLELSDADTLSFHLGTQESTLDVKKAEIEDRKIAKVENLANEIIWENRPVGIQFVKQEELQGHLIRSMPDLKDDPYRLIIIDNFDTTACGGTHVANTGEIGQIKIVKRERFRGGTRITFVCGDRALKDYQFKNSLVNQLASEFTTSADQIGESVGKLLEDNKNRMREIKKLQKKYIELEAEKYIPEATKIGSINIVNRQFSDRDPDELRLLANHLSRRPETIVLFALNEPRLQFIFCRSNDAPGEMNTLLSLVVDGFESTKGGGSEKFAQASGPPAHSSRVNQALMEAQQYLVEFLR